MTRITNNNKTQSFVPAPTAMAPIAGARCACRASGQKAFGKSIGSMPNIDP